ncbi:MAG: YtrH family sporulation protein [Clostridia bacterium]
MVKVLRTLMPPFMTALGVTAGGALVGGLGQWIVGEPAPDYAALAFQIRIWAVAVAIGGAMTALENLEREFLSRGVFGLFRDLAVAGIAYLGAQVAYLLIRALAGS